MDGLIKALFAAVKQNNDRLINEISLVDINNKHQENRICGSLDVTMCFNAVLSSAWS